MNPDLPAIPLGPIPDPADSPARAPRALQNIGLGSLLDEASLPLILHNQHQILEVSPAASQLFGWSAAVLRECLLTDLASGRMVSLVLQYACAPTREKTPVVLIRRGGFKFRGNLRLVETLQIDGRTLWLSEVTPAEDDLAAILDDAPSCS